MLDCRPKNTVLLLTLPQSLFVRGMIPSARRKDRDVSGRQRLNYRPKRIERNRVVNRLCIMNGQIRGQRSKSPYWLVTVDAHTVGSHTLPFVNVSPALPSSTMPPISTRGDGESVTPPFLHTYIHTSFKLVKGGMSNVSQQAKAAAFEDLTSVWIVQAEAHQAIEIGWFVVSRGCSPEPWQWVSEPSHLSISALGRSFVPKLKIFASPPSHH